MYEKILLQKLLITSKYATYCMLLQSMALTFAFANNGGAQTKRLNEIYISVHLEGLSLEDALVEIGKKSDFMFVYNDHKVKKHEEAGIQSGNKALYEILLKLSKDHGLRFKRVDQNIFVNRIKHRDRPVEEVINTDPPADIDIYGKITDENGQGLPGASILEKGTTNGTITDNDGNYRLSVKEDARLVISFIGYLSEEVGVDGRTIINFQMTPDLTHLEEVVVVGYGTMKEVNVTGSYAQVDGEILENRPVQNIGQALQGQIANLNITTVGDPGGVGTPANFNIRGFTSLNGGEPLYVVDGVPVESLQNINPVDVKSVTVLKDAAASAIYGGRAAFGVILVTTKTGKKDRVTVNYNNMFAWSAPTTLPKMANALEFALATNESGANSGANPLFSDEHLDRIRTYMENPGSIPTTLPRTDNPNAWGWVEGNDNIDWYDLYLRDWAPTQKHDLSISGGTDKITYYLSVGHFYQGGKLKFGNDRYKRNNLASSIRAEPTDWMRIELKTRYADGEINNPHAYPSLAGNWFHLAGTRWPTWPFINPDGNPSWIGMRPKFTQPGRDISREKDLWVIGDMELEPIKGWKTNIQYSTNQITRNSSEHMTPIYQILIDGSKSAVTPNSRITRRLATNNYRSLNFYSSYEKEFGEHYFKFLVGQQIENWNATGISGTNLNLITNELASFSVATGDPVLSNALTQESASGTFGRLNYNYKGKYLFEFNARYDGTSRFPEGDRYGFFPSLSLGYDISKENFWPTDKVNQLKIRASYGSLGNQDVPNYLYLAQVPIRNQLGYVLGDARPNFLRQPGLVTSQLTWETVQTLNFGLDVAFLDDKLMVSFDRYIRKTLDMLGPQAALPAVLGAAVPVGNNSDLETKGIELRLDWRDKIGEINYNITLVMSDNITEITRYHNPTGLLSVFEGQMVGDIWGYTSDGLFQTEEQIQNAPDQSLFFPTWNLGDVRYKDLDGDGEITRGSVTVDDHGDLSVIGNNNPRYSYGFTVGADWKGFDLSMFVQGVAKRDFWLSGTNFWGFLGSYGSAVWETTLDYWSPENTDAYWPRPYANREIRKNQQVQTRFLQNAAYMRLKNLQIGYTFPTELVGRLGLQRVRIFASGENLLTFSGINENFDPEVIGGRWGSGKLYPVAKIISFGANVQF